MEIRRSACASDTHMECVASTAQHLFGPAVAGLGVGGGRAHRLSSTSGYLTRTQVVVPDLVGLPQPDAQKSWNGLGFDGDSAGLIVSSARHHGRCPRRCTSRLTPTQMTSSRRSRTRVNRSNRTPLSCSRRSARCSGSRTAVAPKATSADLSRQNRSGFHHRVQPDSMRMDVEQTDETQSARVDL